MKYKIWDRKPQNWLRGGIFSPKKLGAVFFLNTIDKKQKTFNRKNWLLVEKEIFCSISLQKGWLRFRLQNCCFGPNETNICPSRTSRIGKCFVRLAQNVFFQKHGPFNPKYGLSCISRTGKFSIRLAWHGHFLTKERYRFCGRLLQNCLFCNIKHLFH